MPQFYVRELMEMLLTLRFPHRLINSLVMDFLVSEGYPSAAQSFAQEANIQPRVDPESIQERVEIRNAIYAGDVQTAIEKINELNPQILDRDPALHFSLLRLHLIELIRSPAPNAITTAISFASTHLAPRAPTNPAFLEDFERTMALLIFPADKLTPPLAALLDPQLKKEVAKNVNEAIQKSQGERSKSRLLELIRARAWAEKRAREAKKDLPGVIGVGLEREGLGQREDSIMEGNGHVEGTTV
ncbi:MAG: hypothetical protein MMC33_010038 [Icmadophila ericetorum]|nr:hypothetical protein [Icmadophila ericetorum]